MRNITISQYMKSANALDYSPLKFLEPYNAFETHRADIQSLTYEEVKSVIRTLKNIKTWKDISDVFETVFKITPEQFKQGKITSFFSAKNYIIQEFERIVKTENKLLQSISKDYGKFMAAGGERLNRFGDIIPLIQLGEIFGLYPFDLATRPYKEIFAQLVYIKERDEINRKMQE